MATVAPGTGLRWGIYCRISVERGEKGDDDFVSLETQEDGCRNLIAQVDPGGIVVGQYVIREIHSGVELFERQQLAFLREGIRRREIDAVAVFQPKRLSRDPDHASYLKTEAEYYGVKYRFALDDHGDSDAGALLNYLEHWTGKREHKDITERTMRTRVALAAERAWPTHKPRYGFRWTFRTETKRDGRKVMKRHRWEEDLETAPTVRWLFNEALRGASMRAMKHSLEARAVPSPTGSATWQPTTIRKILHDPIYAGDVATLRTVKDEGSSYIGTRGKSRGRKMYRRRWKPADEWVRMPADFAPTLVERRVFDAVQHVLLANRDRAGRKMKYPELTLMAGGRAICGICGSPLSPRCPHKGRPQLFCYHREKHPDTNRPGIACYIVDDAVKKVARLIYEHPEVIREQAELHRQEDPTTADLDMVERALFDLERRIQSVGMVAQNVASPEAAATLALQLESLTDQKKRAQQERRELLDRRAGWEAAQQVLDGFATLCGRVKERLDTFGHPEWQEAVDALGISVAVWPDSYPSRFKIRVRLEGLMTAALLERLAAETDGAVAKLITTC